MNPFLFLLEVLINLLGELGASSIKENLSRLLKRTAPPPKEPSSFIQEYLATFLVASHAPRWDSHLFSKERMGKSQVQVGELRVESDLEPNEESAVPRYVRILPVGSFLKMILLELGINNHRVRTQSGHAHVLIILGDPASGKSTTLLQVAHLLAIQAQENEILPIPIYINLIHFDSRYSLDVEGLRQLLIESLTEGCPRYLSTRESGTKTKLGASSATELLDCKFPTRLLFIFDGMDEMPISDEFASEQNRRIEALGDFIAQNPLHRFIVTCRRSDYIQLRNYSQNYQMAKLKIMPWNRKMFFNYLDARSSENVRGLEQIRDTLRNTYRSDIWGQFKDSPLLGVLLFGGADLKAPRTISEVWGNFIRLRLLRNGKTEQYESALRGLEEFAFISTLKPAEAFPLSADTFKMATDSGILVSGKPNPKFAIKPLQHYFAACHIWRDIASGGHQMHTLEITHPKLEVTFKMVAELAGTDRRFTEYLVRQLRKKAEIHVDAKRFELFTSSLSICQPHLDQRLQEALIDILEKVIEDGTAGDFDLCVRGIGAMPSILSINWHRSDNFVQAILINGTYESQRRLLQLMVQRPRIGFKFRVQLLSLIGQYLDSGQLGAELRYLVDTTIERSLGHHGFSTTVLGIMVRTIILSITLIYLYGVYIASLFLTHASINFSAKLLKLQWQSPSLILLPGSLIDWTIRLIFIFLATFLPWMLISRMARAEYRFNSLLLRVVTLLGVSFLIRYMLLIPFLGIAVLNTISSALEYAVFAGFLLLPIGVLAHTIVNWRGPVANMNRIHIELLSQPVVLSHRDRKSYIPKRGPLDNVLRILTKYRVGRLIYIFVALGIVISLLLVYRLEIPALSLLILVGAAYVLRTFVFDPYREFQVLSNHVHTHSRDSLKQNYEQTIDQIFNKIESPALITPFRKKYIHILETEVLWNQEFLERFQRLSRSDKITPDIRRYMEAVITKKRIEIQQNTNPSWGEY